MIDAGGRVRVHYSLRNPTKDDLNPRPVPLIERNPLLFWNLAGERRMCV
jgi:hypothetical protein